MKENWPVSDNVCKLIVEYCIVCCSFVYLILGVFYQAYRGTLPTRECAYLTKCKWLIWELVIPQIDHYLNLAMYVTC